MIRNLRYYGNWIIFKDTIIGNVQLSDNSVLLLPETVKKFKLKSDKYKLSNAPILEQIQQILKS